MTITVDAQERERMTTPPARGIAAARNGCWNHEPYRDTVWVRDGHEPLVTTDPDGPTYVMDIVREIDNPMSKECDYTQHTKTNGDPRCADCIWKTNTPTIKD